MTSYRGQEITWETNETIDFLNGDAGDESLYPRGLSGQSAREIEYFVVIDRAAPAGLYESFERYHASFGDVDWHAVAYYLNDESDSEDDDEEMEEDDIEASRESWATQQILLAMEVSPSYRMLCAGESATFIRHISHEINLPEETILSFKRRPDVSMRSDVNWTMVAREARNYSDEEA